MSAKGTVLKRVRQSRKANARNKHYKTLVKTVTKKVLAEKLKQSQVKEKQAIEEANKIVKKLEKLELKISAKSEKVANLNNSPT